MTHIIHTQAELETAIGVLVGQDPRWQPVFEKTGMPALRRKGDRLTAYLEWLLLARGVEVLTPRERGSMLTVRFRRPGMVAGLRERGAAVDLRPPDIVRIAPAPLYNSFQDVQQLGALIAELQRA